MPGVLSSCAGFSPFASRKGVAEQDTDSVAKDSLLVDPWSLGPDVFKSNADSAEVNESLPTKAEVMDPNGQAPLSVNDSLSAFQETPEIELLVQPVQSAVVFGYALEIGAYLDRAKATTTAARASTSIGLPGTLKFENPYYRVRLGEVATRAEADSLYRVAMTRGYHDASIVVIELR
ncbi:SPOR domain-containing protein [bacterium]|nr:SPOR domain-containing protein [bacterium]